MNKIDVIIPERIGCINPNVYGHFAEHIGGVIYDGIWLGEGSDIPNIDGIRKKLVTLMKKIEPSVIRWPGGCFAETYNWRDGIGPREERPTTVNWWYNWDGKTESNELGTHEFINFCRLVGAEPYIAANVTTVSPLSIRNWAEYCNMPENTTSLAKLRAENGSREPFNVKYWGIGNENWGGGGNMTPEDYCSQYRKVGTTIGSIDDDLKLIACGASTNDLEWTRRFFEKWNDTTSGYPKKTPLYGYAVHYYCRTDHYPFKFSEKEWYQNLHQASYMEKIIKEQGEIIDTYNSDVKLIIDEWGNWHPEGSGPSNGENLFEQQSTMKDALVAALTLNIFNNHCDKVAMTNVAQLVNNLHSLFLADGENIIPTPNYYVYLMYKDHQGANAVKTILDSEKISFDYNAEDKKIAKINCSASIKDDILILTVVNSSISEKAEVDINLLGTDPDKIQEIVELNADDPRHYNDFENSQRVKPVKRNEMGNISDSKIYIKLKPASITKLKIKLNKKI